MKNIEAEIKRLITENDPRALELIYTFAGRELYKYLIGITNSQHDVEDLLNDLFIKISEKRGSLLKAKNLKAYIYKMATNMAYDRIKQKKRQEAKLTDYSIIIEARDKENISEEEIAELNTALKQLPIEQKEVIILKTFMDKTFEEAAKIINVSINTAVSRYRYALKNLKVILGERS